MIAQLNGVTYRYPGADSDALRNVTLDIPEDAFALVAGPSAGGKSTLLRLFNGLVPQFHGGRLSGSVRVAGQDAARTPTRQLAGVVGMVFQEPEAQSVAENVEDEIAFAMEQQGVAPIEMRRTVDRLLAQLGIDNLKLRALTTLSGGERQRLAIAAVLAGTPRLLILDEPASQLDAEGAGAVIDTVRGLHERGDLAVLIAEHRLERLLPVVSTVIGVEGGIANRYAPEEAAGRLAGVPAVCDIARRLRLGVMPLTEAAFREKLGSRTPVVTPREQHSPGAELLSVEGVGVRFGELAALQDADFTLCEGEVVALIGPNGSGKTTLLRAIAGVARQATGNVRFEGIAAPAEVRGRTAFAGLVPQDPALALFRESVAEEVGETLRGRKQGPNAGAALASWNLASLASRHPRDLSVGQQERVAIGAMLAHEPRIWMLDEPTRGADARAKESLSHRIADHAAGGGAVIVATHDIESATRYATRVIALDAGRIAFDLPVRVAFGSGGPMPSQAARVCEGAIAAEEVSW